jgi:hypothetical protein
VDVCAVSAECPHMKPFLRFAIELLKIAEMRAASGDPPSTLARKNVAFIR